MHAKMPYASKGLKTILLVGPDNEDAMMEEEVEEEEEEQESPDVLGKLTQISSRIKRIERKLGIELDEDDPGYDPDAQNDDPMFGVC